MNQANQESAQRAKSTDLITLFLCGDVMTGRGIDQILSHPGDPEIHEGYMHREPRILQERSEIDISNLFIPFLSE
jgi:hypothetical protein